jgi:hypothetical protein
MAKNDTYILYYNDFHKMRLKMLIPVMSSTDSGACRPRFRYPRKSGRYGPDCWSACSGFSGRHGSDSLVDMLRFRWSTCAGLRIKRTIIFKEYQMFDIVQKQGELDCHFDLHFNIFSQKHGARTRTNELFLRDLEVFPIKNGYFIFVSVNHVFKLSI